MALVTGQGGPNLEKRDAILDAALRAMSRASYEGAGLRDIAAEAGVAVGTVYVHFPGGKHELLMAMAERLAADLQATDFSSGPADGAAVGDAVRQVAEFWAAHRDLARVLVTQSLFDAEVADAVRREVTRPLEAVVRRAAAGSGADSPTATARMMHGLALHLLIIGRELGTTVSPKKLAADAEELLSQQPKRRSR